MPPLLALVTVVLVALVSRRPAATPLPLRSLVESPTTMQACRSCLVVVAAIQTSVLAVVV
jgi:hypothetical protein